MKNGKIVAKIVRWCPCAGTVEDLKTIMTRGTPLILLLAMQLIASAFHSCVGFQIPSFLRGPFGKKGSDYVGGRRRWVPKAALSSVEVLDDQALKRVLLKHPSGSEATVYPFGATLTSFRTFDGEEVIAVRKDAKMDGSKAISGGIPHCFPQFGPGELPQHGFARNMEWRIKELSDEFTRNAYVTLELTDNDETRKIWDKSFSLEYTVTLRDVALSTDLRVRNLDHTAHMEFTAALHSYWNVSSLANVEVVGAFKGARVIDRQQSPHVEGTEDEYVLRITEPTDKMYCNLPGEVVIKDTGYNRMLSVKSPTGFEDVVLWSPYGDESMGFDDFLCVENAAASSKVTVPPLDEWRASMRVDVRTLPRARS
ncbi:unnamed protein product [Vitrella brassicaformis CCMP3155]|uniref:glucose-6-phosphate 1-epimerase n=2 Tax=Vitrella brassicaformis TaxID=1169539 RepID=A0A0G4FHW2_VITBC|nr:unnamed protein product [Vitrella brassicaformis CCMP3155]|eukprot:CEM12673.1 unnamed protein product [Vitrella brassicaformis CCMP3155]